MKNNKSEKQAVITTILLAENDGHVYLPKNELVRRCMALHPYLTSQEVLTGMKALQAEEQVNVANDRCAMTYTLRAEDRLAEYCAEYLSNNYADSDIDWERAVTDAEQQLEVCLSASQRAAAIGALTHRFSIITGGAGSGKTTLLRAIHLAYKKFYPNNYPLMTAPTGKAARRMSQQAHCVAHTIHSVLYSSRGERLMNDYHIYNAGMVIVDEVSMVDIPLMRDLMSHLSPQARLIIVGDPAQLPSIGPGHVLCDLVASGLPVYHLTDNFRQVAQQNALAANVDSIRRQDPDLTYDDSFRLLTAGNSAEAEDMILEFYIHLLLNGKDVQILTPVGKTRICSTATLNRKAQALVNPSCTERLEVKIGERVFRAGDRVVQLKNNDYGRNGDIATIISIQCGSTVTVTIRFDDNERTVTYSASQIKRDNLQQFQLRKRIAGFTKPTRNIAYRNSLKRFRESLQQRVSCSGFDLSQNGFQL